jgi:hypothetical protein
MFEANAQAITILPALSRLPEGCKLFPVSDEANSPALKPGQWAVTDPRVEELEYGAVYLIRDYLRDMIWQALEPREFKTLRGAPAAILAPLNKAAWEDHRYRPGPAQIGWVMDNMIGRVIGVYEQADAPALSVLA